MDNRQTDKHLIILFLNVICDKRTWNFERHQGASIIIFFLSFLVVLIVLIILIFILRLITSLQPLKSASPIQTLLGPAHPIL